MIVKAGFLNLYRLSTGIAVVKNGVTILYRFSTNLTVPGEHMQGFNRFRGSQLLNIYKPSTDFDVGKMCIMIRYKHSTGFMVIKTGLLNLCSPSTGHRVVKTGLLTLHRLLTGNAETNAETKTSIKILYRL